MKLFGKPSTRQVVEAREEARDAKATIEYVDRSLRNHGRNWDNRKVQEYRVERHNARERLRQANQILGRGK